MFSASSYPLSSPICLPDFQTPDELKTWISHTFPDYFARELILKDLMGCIVNNPDPNHKIWEIFIKIFRELETSILYVIKILDKVTDKKLQTRIIGWQELVDAGNFITIADDFHQQKRMLATLSINNHPLAVDLSYIDAANFKEVYRTLVLYSATKQATALHIAINLKLALEGVRKKITVIDEAAEFIHPEIDTPDMVRAKINFLRNEAPAFDTVFLNAKVINKKLTKLLEEAKQPAKLEMVTMERATLFFELKVAINFICRALVTLYNACNKQIPLSQADLTYLRLQVKNGKFAFIADQSQLYSFFLYIDVNKLTEKLERLRTFSHAQRLDAFPKTWDQVTSFQKAIDFSTHAEHSVISGKVLWNPDGSLTPLGVHDFDIRQYFLRITQNQEAPAARPLAAQRSASTGSNAKQKPGAKALDISLPQTSSAPGTPASQAPASAIEEKKSRFQQRTRSLPEVKFTAPLPQPTKSMLEILIEQINHLQGEIKLELADVLIKIKALSKEKSLQQKKFEAFADEVWLLEKNFKILQEAFVNTEFDYAKLPKLADNEMELRQIKIQLQAHSEVLVSNKNVLRELEKKKETLLFQEKNQLARKAQPAHKPKSSTETVLAITQSAPLIKPEAKEPLETATAEPILFPSIVLFPSTVPQLPPAGRSILTAAMMPVLFWDVPRSPVKSLAEEQFEAQMDGISAAIVHMLDEAEEEEYKRERENFSLLRT